MLNYFTQIEINNDFDLENNIINIDNDYFKYSNITKRYQKGILFSIDKLHYNIYSEYDILSLISLTNNISYVINTSFNPEHYQNVFTLRYHFDNQWFDVADLYFKNTKNAYSHKLKFHNKSLYLYNSLLHNFYTEIANINQLQINISEFEIALDTSIDLRQRFIDLKNDSQIIINNPYSYYLYGRELDEFKNSTYDLYNHINWTHYIKKDKSVKSNIEYDNKKALERNLKQSFIRIENKTLELRTSNKTHISNTHKLCFGDKSVSRIEFVFKEDVLQKSKYNKVYLNDNDEYITSHTYNIYKNIVENYIEQYEKIEDVFGDIIKKILINNEYENAKEQLKEYHITGNKNTYFNITPELFTDSFNYNFHALISLFIQRTNCVSKPTLNALLKPLVDVLNILYDKDYTNIKEVVKSSIQQSNKIKFKKLKNTEMDMQTMIQNTMRMQLDNIYKLAGIFLTDDELDNEIKRVYIRQIEINKVNEIDIFDSFN